MQGLFCFLVSDSGIGGEWENASRVACAAMNGWICSGMAGRVRDWGIDRAEEVLAKIDKAQRRCERRVAARM